MKAKIEIEFEYEDYEQMAQAFQILFRDRDGLEAQIKIERVTATCYDSDNKPFMTETPIGSTPQ